MPVQQQAPRRIGFPPDLISFIILLLRPIAAIAMMIKNLLSSFKGENTAADIPKFMATVVMTDASIK